MISLEEEVKLGFSELQIDTNIEMKVWNYLEHIKSYHLPTYNHSLRVGILARKIAEFTHIDSKDIFLAGLIHDIGKINIDKKILNNKGLLSENDMNIIQTHVNFGYDLVRDDLPIVAEIMRRHHTHQQNSYPIIANDDFGTIPKNITSSILWNSRLLALADFYDALTTRNNDKFYSNVEEPNRKKSDDEYLKIMIKNNSDQEKLIKDLSLAGILKGFYKEIKNNTSEHKKNELYNTISWPNKYFPDEVARKVMIACALEPLSNKYGCTTRYIDSHPCIKLEYFISAAINIGDSFRELAERMQKYDYMQDFLIYDLAYKAQCDAKKNHAGGRINQGIIELLIPIVAAQMSFRYYNEDADCEHTLIVANSLIRKSTSREDVDFLVKMKRFAFDLCGYNDREIKTHPSANSIYQYYYKDMFSSPKDSTAYLHNYEFVNRFPTVKKIYNIILNDSSPSLMQRTENAYKEIRLNEHQNVGEGLTADYVACALYLLLSSNQKDIVIV